MGIVTTLLTIIAGFLTLLWQKEKERRIDIEKQLSKKKYEVYELIIEQIFKLSRKDNKELINKDTFLTIQKELIFYGNDSVIKKWVKFFQIANKEKHPPAVLSSIIDVLIEIRKDMGYPKTNINREEFLRILTNATEEEYKAMLKEMA